MKKIFINFLCFLTILWGLSISVVKADSEPGDTEEPGEIEEPGDTDNLPDQTRTEALSTQFGVTTEQVDAIRLKEGWGGTSHQLSIARELTVSDPVAFPDMTTALANVDALRAEGKGWGNIAKELGFKLGPVVSAASHERNALRKGTEPEPEEPGDGDTEEPGETEEPGDTEEPGEIEEPGDTDNLPDQTRTEALSTQFGVTTEQVDAIRLKEGWGGTSHQLSIARELTVSDPVAFPDMTTALATVDALRAEGKGWGSIAKELGFKLGPVVSAASHERNALRKGTEPEEVAEDAEQAAEESTKTAKESAKESTETAKESAKESKETAKEAKAIAKEAKETAKQAKREVKETAKQAKESAKEAKKVAKEKTREIRGLAKGKNK